MPPSPSLPPSLARAILLILLGLLGGAAAPGPASAQATRARIRVTHTRTDPATGQVHRGESGTEELWVGEGLVALQRGPDRYVVDEGRGILAVHSLENGTSLHLPLPLKLEEALTPLGALRLRSLARLEGVPGEAGSAGEAAGRACAWTEVTIRGDGRDLTLSRCLTTDLPFAPADFPHLYTPLQRFLHPDWSSALLRSLAGEAAFPLIEEERWEEGGVEHRVRREVVEMGPAPASPEIFRDPPGHGLKRSLTWEALLNRTAGPLPSPRDPERDAIRSLLARVQEGYLARDTALLDGWLEENFTEQPDLLGTNAVFPGDFEWRSGRGAAREMFANDWLRFGDLEMFIEDAEVTLLGDAAWATVFATATRDPTQGAFYRSAEASRDGSLSRIRDLTEAPIPSMRALYEIIQDASLVLAQYERSPIFVWPLRMTFLLVRTEAEWRIAELHWSWPGSGFPAVRLIPGGSME